jgi:hypothetical protein
MPQPTLNARALKCTVVLDPAEVAQLAAPDGQPRVAIEIRLPDRRVSAELNAKSVRRSLAMLGEHGPDGVAVIVQGRLVGDTIIDAGIFAQPKGPSKEKPEATPAAPLPGLQDAVQPAERLKAALDASVSVRPPGAAPGGAWLDAASEARRQRDDWKPEVVGRSYARATRPLRG